MDNRAPESLPFKISVLVFIRHRDGRELLLRRRKPPNQDCWSPIGGKLEMALGESPLECAVREVGEEIGLAVEEKNLHLFGMISEKHYEGQGHWLMFLYRCDHPLETLPPTIEEGEFAFHALADIPALPIPETDRRLLWPIYTEYRDRFVAMRADCHPDRPFSYQIEEVI